MNFFRFIIITICFFSTIACSPGIVPSKPSLNLESKISNPIFIDSSTLSSEPTVFVRSMSLEATGAKDLDSMLEQKLSESGHRLVSRSDGARIKITSKLVYLGGIKNISATESLQAGYESHLVYFSEISNQDSQYHSIAFV